MAPDFFTFMPVHKNIFIVRCQNTKIEQCLSGAVHGNALIQDEPMVRTIGSTGKIIAAGLAFAILWASASSATKIGLQVAQPFVLAVFRFFIAAATMLVITHIVMGKRMPAKKEWAPLMIYGLLNITIYLGLYVIALQYVSAGIAALSIAASPVYISLISSFWFRQPLKKSTGLSLLICSAGILIASWPLLQTSYVTPFGLIVLMSSMLSYSLGTIYFSRAKWNDLAILTINGWQTLFGGIFLFPFMLFYYDGAKNDYGIRLAGSALWLAIPVSICALQLWMYLLRDNPVKASFWLFLCPVFGFLIAALLLQEPLGFHTLAGVTLTLAGLMIVQKQKRATR